jgi:nickel transport protein
MCFKIKNVFKGAHLTALMATLILIFCMAQPSALAHRVNVFAWVEGDTVHTQSKFSGGGQPKGAKIEVYDDKGHKLLQGQTDAKGYFAFKLPQKTPLEVVLKSGGGHQNSWQIPLEEILAANADSHDKDLEGPPTNPTPAAKMQKVPAKATVPGAGRPCDCLAKIDQALNKRLGPLISRLNRLQDKLDGPRPADIFGGIGYILGLMGLAAYVRYRKKPPGKPS